ncbi:cAMP-dependent protein kinase regulatory subunit BCY1 PWA37_001816 [Arxiozyma heterogenica]|uniref:cAMP-dependent protein kinase regulatory subunit n=1 Tax=Arxiozyma heterogenica TaxID=278026 RepID=A0AAN7WQM0_9SACH|nr:hypothetical protein RI543_002363 [Kazachstania heterogenica]
MPLSEEQQFELDQFKKEVELRNPSDFLQFGANYFNQRLEVQRKFIKKQEELSLSKGIVLFPPMSQHDSISLTSPQMINSRSQSRTSITFSNPNFGSSSKLSLSKTTTVAAASKNNSRSESEDPLAKTPDNENLLFKPSFATDEDPISNISISTNNSQVSIKAPVPAPSSSSPITSGSPISITQNSSNPSTFNNNIFKGGFNIGQEASRKRINSPLDPSDPTTKRKSTPPPNSSSDISSNDNNSKQQQQQQQEVFHPIPSRFNAERRTSVSGETLQPSHFDNWTPENYKEKTEAQLKRLEKSIGKNFLFNRLDPDSKKLVINCLEEKHVEANDIIIKQGDEGDYFYIVEDGNVEFYVNDVRVSTSGPGSSFGELALMYNNPRAATVVATTDCILWTLDRLTFRKILLGSSFKKRVLYDDLLKSIPVLQKLTTYERSKLADALDTQYFNSNEIIIREGDRGENFYLIEYGEVQVIKEGKGVIATLGKGDYFGELALLKDVPRQATIKTTKRTKVATLGKSGFQRLLGPVVEVLKLNDPTR